ncbi:MAG: L,D-transpeptidase [Actinomycetota bacterium]|nr:L,D-transpeptidase [Actinomycetota bacterium]
MATAPTAPPVTLPGPPAGSTLVAATSGAVAASDVPGGPPTSTIPATWYGYPSALPVIDEVAGWVRVRLAQRPNQAAAWVPRADVMLSSTPYRIVIDVTADRLQVLRSGTPIMDLPAGVGTSNDPTVTGHYFMTMRVPAPNAAYGPFVLVTSAHSDTITDWEGSGDAIVAIHGPIDAGADNAIGSTGAKISHGCIRLHDADLARLDMIPAGTPIDIVASS